MTIVRFGAALLGLCGASLLLVQPTSAADFTAKLAYVSQPTNPFHKGMEVFAQKVAELTKGRVEVKLFHSSQLGGERDYIEGLQFGTVEMAATSVSPLTGFEKSIGLLTLPFLFRSSEHLDLVTDGAIGKTIAAKYVPKGIRILGYPDLGARLMYNSQRLVRTPEDMKGLKFRATENPIHIETYKALGARAVPMARPEVYSALKQGVLDGLDAGISFYESMGDYEVATHLTLGVELFQTPGALMVSERFFQRLPPELRTAIQQAADQAVPEQRKIFRADSDAVLARMRAKGVNAQVADPKPFAEAARPVWDKFANDVGGRELIDQVLATK